MKQTKNKKRPTSASVEIKWTPEDVIEAIRQAGGMITDTCKILNMNPCTFYRKWRYHPDIEAEFQSIWRIGAQTVIDTIYTRSIAGDMKAAALYMRYCPYTREMGWTPEENTVKIKTEKPLTPEEIEQAAKDIFG